MPGPTPPTHAALHLGPLEQALDRDFEALHGKFFLRRALGLSGCEVSLTRARAGQAMPFLHRHVENEELYIVIRGSGRFHVDGQEFPVAEGSLVRVAPEAARGWTAGDEDLLFICVQGKAGSMAWTDRQDGRKAPGQASWQGS